MHQPQTTCSSGMKLVVAEMPVVIASYALPSVQTLVSSKPTLVSWSNDYMYVAHTSSRSLVNNCTFSIYDAKNSDFIGKTCIHEQRTPYDMVTSSNGGAVIVGTCNDDAGGFIDYYDPIKQNYQASKCYPSTIFSSVGFGM